MFIILYFICILSVQVEGLVQKFDFHIYLRDPIRSIPWKMSKMKNQK